MAVQKDVNLNQVYGEESWNEYFERKLKQILDKLDHMEFNGQVSLKEPHHLGGESKSIKLNLTRKGTPFKLQPRLKESTTPVRKLTDLDWLNIMQHYKMLLDGFQRADWSQDEVREQVASTMIKKTKQFFEDNYPDLIEIKKKPIFDKEDFK